MEPTTCTLDGERATATLTNEITPRGFRFVLVRSLEDLARSAEWAEESALRIIERGGDFRTR
jgi:hypothetical protein